MAGGSHEAKLSTIINEKEELLENNLKEVENKISEIVGLDYKTFGKLVYIKQKDLDSLKELVKSDREQLINKMIGIEEFGQAEKQLKDDLKLLETESELAKKDFENQKDTLARFKRLQGEIKEYEIHLKDLQKQERELGKKEAELKKQFDVLTWIKDYTSLENHLAETVANLKNLNEQKSDKEKIKEHISKIDGDIKNSEKFKLENWKNYDHLKNLEQITKQKLEQIGSLKDDHVKIVEKNGDLLNYSKWAGKQDKFKEIPKLKAKSLTYAAGSFIIAIASVFAGVFLSPLIFIGLLLFIPTLIFVKKYLDYEKFSVEHQEYISNEKIIQEKNEKIALLNKQLDEDLKNDGFADLNGLKKKVGTLLNELREKIRVENFEALDQKIKQTKKEKEGKEEELLKLSEKISKTPEEKLNGNLEKYEKQFKKMEKNKPINIEKIEYSEKKFLAVKKEYDTAKNNSHENTIKLSEVKGLLKKSKKDLEADEYIDIEKKFNQTKDTVKFIETEDKSLKLLREIMKETSQELRSQVIPRAQITIENLLPTITDNRYFKLDIKEDFTFNTYSSEAKQNKPKDLFSGGTQDQFLIALRLAFAQSVLEAKRQYQSTTSLFMDECISSSDNARKKGIFAILDSLKKDFTQIFIIAHEDITHDVDYCLKLGRNSNGYTFIKTKNW